MKFGALKTACLLELIFAGVALPGFAQDNVTIPRSRLEELERKEKELEKLRTQPPPAPQSAPIPASDRAAATSPGVAAVPSPAPVRLSPPLASLPPLKEKEEVDALDLAAHYRSDPAAADRRYRGRRFLLRGEIVAFEKPAFRRDYEVLLKTPDRDAQVVCTFDPPENVKAVFTVNHGSGLVALVGENRMPLAKVGDRVILSARCKGHRGAAVLISGADLKLVPPPGN